MGEIRVVNCTFKEQAGSGFKVVSVSAKRARGMFCRYMAEKKCDFDGAMGFNLGGYKYNKAQSSDDELVFTRTTKAAQDWKLKQAKKKAQKTGNKKRKVSGR